MMRTCYVGTEVPADLAEAAAAVAAAVDAAKELMVPGARCCDVDAATRALLTREGSGWVNSLRTAYSIGIGFYTDWGEAELLTIDPGSTQTLEAGMVLHLIPWIQLPSKGQGIALRPRILTFPKPPWLSCTLSPSPSPSASLSEQPSG